MADVPAALAASRFAPGPARQRCEVTFTATVAPVATAPAATLYELAGWGLAGFTEEALRARAHPAGADCLREPGSPRQINYPPFERIAEAPGTRSWTYLAFDVTPAGRVTHPRLLASSGNTALDREGLRALAANRYTPGRGHHGCTFRYYHAAAADPAPVALPPGTPADTGELAACRIDPKTITPLLSGNAYPAAFLRRRIAGVVAIRFDTAPWGAIGDVEVIASEPSEEFGGTVRSAFYGARVAPSEVGHRDCVRHIRFRLPPAGERAAPPDITVLR